MSALTTPRDCKPRGTMPIPQEMDVGVKAGSKCIQGGMIGIDSSGYATPMVAAAGMICLGICDPKNVSGQTSLGPPGVAGIDDNTNGANGAIKTHVVPGIRKMNNGTSTDTVLVTDIGQDCFALDDNTVARTDKGNTLSRAGKIVDVDTDGVWVCLGMALAGAALPSQLAPVLDNLGIHAPVRAVVPANFVGTVTAGVLTATSNGALATQDGVTLAVGDRVLVAAQTTAADNGIYVVTSLGGASAKAVFTRASDGVTGAAIIPAETVAIAEGTLFAGTIWVARVTGTNKLVGTDDPKFYPNQFKKTVTLVAGTYTIGAGGGGEPCFLFSTTLSSVEITRNTANTSTATTGGYSSPAASRVAGVGGTGAVMVRAEVAAGTINNADISTLDVTISN
jgi:hypothetical protein